MRILRLWAPSLIGDHTLCYIHTNRAGETCINDVAIPVRLAKAGEPLEGEAAEKAMTIVLPPEADFHDGDFISVSGGDTLLRWHGAENRLSVSTAGFLGVSEKTEIMRPIRTAVLTISDKGSRGERTDTAGPELENLALAQGCVTEARKIVPDDKEIICATVLEWAESGINLILTTGGTGISPRDNTPEALVSIADKVIPGFGEMMRMETLKYTPRSFLTRSVAISCGNSLVIAFPGSRRGAGQCFEAITGGLRHEVETVIGSSTECGEEKANHNHKEADK